MLFLSFGGMAEVPIASQLADVALKQNSARFYRLAVFVFSDALVRVPLAIVDALLFGALTYWIAGLADDVGRYFFYCLTIGLTALGMGSFFRFLAYVSPSLEVAQAFAGPIVAQLVLFAGYLVTHKKLADWCVRVCSNVHTVGSGARACVCVCVEGVG
jgi:ABC-type multidrug transport system permease subunit